MNFIERQNTRWTGEQMASWSSVSKTVYILFPLVLYYLVTDITDLLLWWALNGVLAGNEAVFGLAAAHSGTVKGFIYLIGIVIYLIIIRKPAFSELASEKENEPIAIRDILIVILLSLVISIGLNYLLSYLGITGVSDTYNEVKSQLYAVDIYFGAFFYGICSPLVEEVLFRGIIYNRLKRVFPVSFSVVISALLFGVFHGNIVQGIYGTLMGLFIAVMYEKYRDIKVPVIIHMVANLGVYVLTYTIWK